MDRKSQCFPINVYDRDMTTDIWLILPYDRAWKKARPYDIAWKKDLSYTWYVCIYTKHRAKYTVRKVYTRDMIVYTRYKQVYKSLNRYILMTLFLAGNSTPTIPHMFSKRKDSGFPTFPYGCADAAAADGRRGSNVYGVNLWLWSFARGKPRLGGLSVEKTFERQEAANEARKERAAENRLRLKAEKA
jgi:hypothetical protein